MKTGLFIFCLLSCGFVAEGEKWLAGSEGTNSSEQYARDNYFSKRRSLIASSSTNISFYSGFSFYRRSSRKTFPLFSSVALGFNQQIKEISGVGDVHFQLSVSSAKMKEKRSYFLDLAGRFSAPAIRWAFPLYVGVGAGVGFAPLYLLRKISPFSAHGQFFLGLRFPSLYHNLGFLAELNLKMYFPFDELIVYMETAGYLGLMFSF